MVYSAPEATGASPPIYGLFMQSLRGGNPRTLSLHRGVSGVGRVVTDVQIDTAGRYVAFRSDRPVIPNAPRA